MQIINENDSAKIDVIMSIVKAAMKGEIAAADAQKMCEAIAANPASSDVVKANAQAAAEIMSSAAKKE